MAADEMPNAPRELWRLCRESGLLKVGRLALDGVQVTGTAVWSWYW